MVFFLKTTQLILSVAVTLLIWAPSPDVMKMILLSIALCYVASCIAAIRDLKYGVWIAFAFTLWIGVAAAFWTVGWFMQNGLDRLPSNYNEFGEIDKLPYLVLTISASAIFIVTLHFFSWRWFLVWDRRK